MNHFDGKESRQVHWARYDPATQTLEIDFKDKNGAKASTYSYAEVTAAAWEAFQAAPSKGAHFASAIRNNYKATKLLDGKK
jgi:KTSC domain